MYFLNLVKHTTKNFKNLKDFRYVLSSLACTTDLSNKTHGIRKIRVGSSYSYTKDFSCYIHC
jgi:hypothetical protein